MNIRNALFILPLLFAFWSCEDDADDNTPQEPDIEQGFWYDGPNATAPLLPEGIYETAARFPASSLSVFDGQTLSAVHLYLLDRPFQMELRIYDEGIPSEPGDVIYSQTINRSSLSEDSWNRIELNNPFTITGEEIWISIKFEHGSSPIQSMGCDAGPRSPDGDRFFAQNTWTNFNVFATGESINWNIRAEVE